MKESENLKFYEQLCNCPENALKPIQAGDLKGFSDINPMWRIKVMTETFGPCGIGWKYEIVKQWNEAYGNEIKTYCNINLYVKVDGEWSEPIPGTGGSTFVAQYSKGTKVSDENYKMALTDALSVCMKMLGVAANIYWQNGSQNGGQFETKYQQADAKEVAAQPQQTQRVPGMQASRMDLLDLQIVKDAVVQCGSKEELMKLFTQYPKEFQANAEFKSIFTARRKQLE